MYYRSHTDVDFNIKEPMVFRLKWFFLASSEICLARISSVEKVSKLSSLHAPICPTAPIPYSLKFSRLKIFAVFAGYDYTTKNLSREFFNMHACSTFMGVAICPCTRARRPSIADVYHVYASAYRL